MMTLAFVIVGLAALFYTLEPLMHEKFAWVEEESEIEEEMRTLEAEKKIYLKALKDIDFEHASEKINLDDYEDLKVHYRTKVAYLMDSIEELELELEEEEGEDAQYDDAGDDTQYSDEDERAVKDNRYDEKREDD